MCDFKKPEDAAFLHRLIARADVFVQNLAPGAAARAGLASEDLRAQHSRLITCDISGYGEVGPYRDMKAYDFLVQCEAGIAAVTGTPKEAARVGVSACDIGAGLNAYGAILEALFAREQTGEGEGIAISLFDGMADWMNVPLMHHMHGAGAPGRSGLSHAMIAPYGAYPVGREGQIVIAIQNNREWARFCAKVLGDTALAEDTRFRTNADRVANRSVMDVLIKSAFSVHDRESLAALLQETGIAFGRFNEVSDLTDHPQLRRISIATASGTVELVAPPARFASDGGGLGPVPALGQHSQSVRDEFA